MPVSSSGGAWLGGSQAGAGGQDSEQAARKRCLTRRMESSNSSSSPVLFRQRMRFLLFTAPTTSLLPAPLPLRLCETHRAGSSITISAASSITLTGTLAEGRRRQHRAGKDTGPRKGSWLHSRALCLALFLKTTYSTKRSRLLPEGTGEKLAPICHRTHNAACLRCI